MSATSSKAIVWKFQPATCVAALARYSDISRRRSSFQIERSPSARKASSRDWMVRSDCADSAADCSSPASTASWKASIADCASRAAVSLRDRSRACSRNDSVPSPSMGASMRRKARQRFMARRMSCTVTVGSRAGSSRINCARARISDATERKASPTGWPGSRAGEAFMEVCRWKFESQGSLARPQACCPKGYAARISDKCGISISGVSMTQRIISIRPSWCSATAVQLSTQSPQFT